MITYPDLPIVAEKEKIIQALQSHNVIVVAGETGSGKTTQLPKICLEAGLGQTRKIGHTQPRRIAARNVAGRVASELQVKLGELVGYKMRFSDQTSEHTRIQIMTDGILLSETQQDKNLSQYDCIIIDEAHERSLNIDFLLGYLKNLLKRRHDLKVIITSATIDVEKFSLFFENAPLIQIPGRSYPIELNYLEEAQFNTDDPAEKVLKVVEMAMQRGMGDLLIFQTGEKEIRELADVLHDQKWKHVHILPLYARQSAREQQKVFDRMSGRKIIIATNVAETSITVPNIRFVIDPGFARISRYNYRNKLQRLPIEAISQASAEQRKGRCGRVGPGICYRLYEETDFKQRPFYTEPEILRVNLAGVILRMLDLGFRPVERFPLIDPLDPRYIKDGLGLLSRLGAIDEHKKITKMGRILANIPVEPKFSRMLIGAQHYGCLKEALIIISGLSIVDPRERPVEEKQKADEAHAAFRDEHSDFMSYLSLWNFLFSHKQTLSHNKFRLLCRQNYLSYLRVCEWFDVHQQLTETMEGLGFTINQIDADYSLIHRAILTGILDGVGLWEDKLGYQGARHIRFQIHPGSTLFKKSPQWIMACEIVHTTKTYGRINAKIEPEWIEETAQHLLKREYYDPHYEPKKGSVVAFEKLSLFGLPLAEKRKVSYERIHLSEAREIFIQQALCEENLQHPFSFFEKNKKTLQDLKSLEIRIRKLGALIDEQALFAFYNKVLPQDVASVNVLKAYLKENADQKLIVSSQEIANQVDLHKTNKAYPTVLQIQETAFEVDYLLDLSSEFDGATLIVPIDILKNVKEYDYSWPIPGWISEKVEYAIRALPKKQRLQVSRMPQTIDKVGTFFYSLSQALKKQDQLDVEPAFFESVNYPAYLNMHFRVVDQAQKELAKDHSLIILFDALKGEHSQSFSPQHALEKQHITQWDFGDLPASASVQRGQHVFTVYPALVQHEGEVQIQLCESEAIAQYFHSDGLTRLAILHCAEGVKYFKKEMHKNKKGFEKLYAPFGTYSQLEDQLIFQAAEEVFTLHDPRCRFQQAFLENLSKHRALFLKTANQLAEEALLILEAFEHIQMKLYRLGKVKQDPLLIQDIDKQLKHLFGSNFITRTPKPWFNRLRVYLKAIEIRLDKFPARVVKDKQNMKEVEKLETQYHALLDSTDCRYLSVRDPLYLFRYSIEELRVSLFAESLKTIETVSIQRLLKILEKFRYSLRNETKLIGK